MAKTTFVNKQQELMWKAFKGECGKEFAGNPVFIENFIALEKVREDSLGKGM